MSVFSFTSGVCTKGRWSDSGDVLASRNPATGEILAEIVQGSPEELGAQITEAEKAFVAWRKIPAPRRGGIDSPMW